LREAEEKFRTIFESSNDAITIIAESGVIDFNDAALRMMGYSNREGLVGTNPGDWSPPAQPDGRDSTEAAKYEVAKAFKEGGNFFEWTHRRADGELFQAEVLLTPMQLDGVQVLQATVRDITERKRAEEALEESEARLQSILDNSTTVIYVKDVDGKYLFINKRYEDLFSVTREKAKGKTDHDIFPSHMANAFRSNDLEVLKTNAPVEFEEVAPHDDGPHTYISVKFPLYDITGAPYAVCGISTDITKRKRSEAELKRSREKLRKLSLYLQNMQEQERARIARDIHDDLGQLLTAMEFDISYMAKMLLPEQKELIKRAMKISELLVVSTETVQRIASELRPPLLDDLGLMAAMEWQAEKYQENTGIDCKVIYDSNIKNLDKDLSTALFRAFQEALTNVARHADATSTCISLKMGPERL
ncbi:unnamed protein product, partial [marine sediment metagenome]